MAKLTSKSNVRFHNRQWEAQSLIWLPLQQNTLDFDVQATEPRYHSEGMDTISSWDSNPRMPVYVNETNVTVNLKDIGNKKLVCLIQENS